MEELIYGLILFAALILGGLFVYNGIYVSTVYFIGIFPIIIMLFIVSYIKRKVYFSRLKSEFISNWGTEVKRKRDFNTIRKVFDYLTKENESFYIDDQTFSDLTMDSIFSLLDRTITSPGEEILYNMLRTPCFTEKELIRRNKIIEAFIQNDDLRHSVGTELLKMSRKKDNDLPSFLWGDVTIDTSKKLLYRILPLLPIIAVVLYIITKNFGFIIFVPIILAINTIVHLKTKQEIQNMTSYIGYLNSLIVSGKNICKIDKEEIEEYKEKLKELDKKLSPIIRKTAGVGRIEGTSDTFEEILYNIFLIEENKFYSAIKHIEKYLIEIKELYLIIGEIDALLSVASYKCSNKQFCTPQFVYEKRYFEAKNITHPLVENAVENDILMNNKGIVLTGSNMSGKSTFLRTIGVNAILAQSFYFVAASYYKASFFKVMTSISPEDNIMSGKSYYFREAEALLRIVKEDCLKVSTLCIIDEIFRGTNPIERVNASAEILKYIEKNGALALVATHDLELCEIINESFQMFYFCEDLDDEGLKFDYKLKKGICNTRNAIRLLKYLNYPDEIIKNTYNRIK